MRASLASITAVSEAEWSSRKAGESGVVRWPNRADTWREESPDGVFGTDEQQVWALWGRAGRVRARSAIPNLPRQRRCQTLSAKRLTFLI